VALQHVQIGHLLARKIGTQKMARVLPTVTIAVEDAITQHGRESNATVAETVVLELQREDRLDIFGLDRYDDWRIDHAVVEGGALRAEGREASPVLLENTLVFEVLYVFPQDVEAEDRILVVDIWAGLAVILLLHAPSRNVEVQAIDQDEAEQDDRRKIEEHRLLFGFL